MRTKLIPLEQLVNDPDNARRHPVRNLATIKESLRKYGQVEPLVVQASSMRVIAGNGRLAAMLELRAEGEAASGGQAWDRASCHVVDVDDATARQLSVTLNRTAELAEWDDEKLHAILREALDGQATLGAMGWTEAEVQKLLGAAEIDVDGLQDGIEFEAEDMPEGPAHVRMIQLFFDSRTIEPFNRAVAKLHEAWGEERATLTEIVTRCVMEAAAGV